MKQIFSMYVNESHSNWHVYLQAAISAYNTQIHSSTGFLPYEVLFARKPVRLADVLLDTPFKLAQTNGDLNAYVRGIRDNASGITAKVNIQVEKTRQQQKKYYDRFKNSSKAFKVGDFVLIAVDKQ